MTDLLERIFISFFNMSVTGSYIILAIILVRLLLKKAPKVFSYSLWIVAGLRLICPFSFSSVLSIFNFFSVPVKESTSGGATVNNYVPNNIGIMPKPEISTGISSADTVINSALPVAKIGDSANPMQIITAVASALWIIGIIAMVIYGIVSLVKIHKRVEFATRLNDNIFECEKVRSPFVLGIIKPRIYLPCNMNDKQREFVVLHEKNHIRRFDHIVKLASFTVLALHWYNPLVWFGYILMIRDMEMSCDERVLKELGELEKKNYSLTLVAIGSNHRFTAAAPLSFGENVVEKRIVNVLNFKKPKALAIILCVAVCITVGIVCLTNATDSFGRKEIQATVEEHIVKKEATEPYKINIAGVEIVEFDKSEKTAYGWRQTCSVSGEYKNLINPNNIEYSGLDNEPTPFKAILDENGGVAEITDYGENSIPEFLGNASEYVKPIFERIESNAVKEYEKHRKLTKIYSTENFAFKCNNPEINKLQVMEHELVADYLGKYYLVLKLKNPNDIGDYSVFGDFELQKQNGEPLAELYYDDGDTVKLTSSDEGEEQLWTGNLSRYINSIEKTHYLASIPVYCENSGEKDILFVEFDVADSEPATVDNPALVYGKSNGVVTVSVTDKIKNAVSVSAYPGANYYCEIVLSKDELNEFIECYNHSDFYPLTELDLKNKNTIYVSIEIEDNKKSSFILAEGGFIKDAEGKSFRCDEQLYEMLFNIAKKYGIEFQPDKATAVGGSVGYNEPTTAPVAMYPDISTTLFHTDVSKNISGAVTMDNSESAVYEEYVISEIKTQFSKTDHGIRVMGLRIYNSDYLEITFTNVGDKTLYATPNQSLKRQVNGEWSEMKIDASYLNDEYYPLYPNTLMTVSFPFGMYFETENLNGKYRFTNDLCYGTDAGPDTSSTVEFVIDFSIERRMMNHNIALGEKIGTPTMVNIFPSTSGVSYIKTVTDAETLENIAHLYNSFDWSKPYDGAANAETNNNMYTYYYMEIIDGDKFVALFVYFDGTVEMNGRRYEVGSGGAKLYNLVAFPWR